MARPIEIEDLARIKYVSDPQISPDGQQVAYVVTEVDLPGRRYRSAIWVAPSTGDEARRFTAGSAKDTAPRWSPDGSRLAFLSDRTGTTQLYCIPSGGGEARQISDLKHGVADPVWSPDGRSVAVTSKLGPEGVVLLGHETEADRQRERERSDVIVIRTLKYKTDGEGFLDDRRRHILIIPADGGPPRQLTDGDWDDQQIAWSPLGDLIAFVSNRTEDRRRNIVSDIWLVDVDNGTTRKLTQSDGEFQTPSFSPDGELVAYVGHTFSPRFGPNTRDDLWVIPTEGGEARHLTAPLDRWVGNSCISDAHYITPPQRPVWLPTGDAILVQVSDRGNVPLVRVGLDGSTKPVIAGERVVINVSACERAIAFTASDPMHPAEVALAALDGSDERAISHANDSLLAELTLNSPERVVYPAEGGVEIEGWVMHPPGSDASGRHPMILSIHGGPHAMYGNTFFHEMQLLAARGYVVLYLNPRGSTDRGQEFAAAAMGDWGGVDFRDLLAGVDHLQGESFIDGDRLGVMGGSYGGYMTNWILTQDNRFRAAVTERSTCNRHSLVGTSDLVWSYSDWEFGGSAYDRPEFYLERSPLSHVANVSAPLLIMHSENDYRCPIEQAEQFFVALMLHNKRVEFVRFPGESHGLSRIGRPDRRVERLQRLAGWFEQHL